MCVCVCVFVVEKLFACQRPCSTDLIQLEISMQSVLNFIVEKTLVNNFHIVLSCIVNSSC